MSTVKPTPPWAYDNIRRLRPAGGGTTEMTSDLLSTNLGGTARRALRLTMKPDAARGGRVDGAWWPWSTDPLAEFPALIAALGAAGDIRRVSYHLDSWDRTDRKLDVGEVVVRMEGFHTMQPDTVTLIKSDYTRIRLLVVPPGTPGGLARAVLRTTSTANAGATVEDILTWNGLTPGKNQPHTVAGARRPLPVPDDEDRWEEEGGAARRRTALRAI